jgi:hypothetical protein
MNEFKLQCIELRRKDHTLNEIVALTGRAKSSVYAHIKDISLSEKKRKQISENARALALSVAKARKGVALRPYKPFPIWSPERVLLMGHLMFDGEILKGKCVYHNRSDTLLKEVEKLMKDVYEFAPKKHVDRVSGVCRLQYNNVALSAFLQCKAFELMERVTAMPLKFQREFVRAFFDDEGCMDYRKKRNLRRVRGYQKDKKILKLIQVLLKNFHIESKIVEPNEIMIIGVQNLITFQKEINFSEGVRINPNRTNSIWKKNLEKRELLRMAISSFPNQN